MPRIRIRDGPNKGLVFQIEEKRLLVGRDSDCAIQVLDKGASRHHAEIFRVGEMSFVRDLGSRNGTHVNDERVHEEEFLRVGDRITVGSTSLIVEGDTRFEDDPRNIRFTEGREDAVGSTLELRLDDLAGLEEDEEDRDAANFRAIFQLGRMLGSERSVEAAQEKALAFIAELVPADQIYLFARDTATGALTPRARYERDPTVQAQVSRSIIRRCLTEFRSMLTTNAMSDARFRGNESVVLKGIRSVICVPVASMGAASGVLYLSSSRVAETFVEEDLELLTAAGTLIGLTIESLESARAQRETLFSAMRALVALEELSAPGRRGHSERVASYALAIARHAGLPEKARVDVRLAALLHDIGKARIPAEALAGKETRSLRPGDPGALHPAVGAEVAGHIAGAEDVAPAVRHHHEHYDGSGYPDGLAGDAIPLDARIVAAADILDHLLTSGGREGTPFSADSAVEVMNGMAGRELDPEVARAVASAHKAGLLSPPTQLYPGAPAAPADNSPDRTLREGPGGAPQEGKTNPGGSGP